MLLSVGRSTVVSTAISQKPLDGFMKFCPDVHDSHTMDPNDLSSHATMRLIFLILGEIS